MDTNGDGFDDVIVGAPDHGSPENREGNVYIFRGQVSGVARMPMVFDSPNDQVAALFGKSVASVGDGNGDGYEDLVIGSPGRADPEVREGAAYLYFGAPGGPGVTPSTVVANPLNQAEGAFGTSVL